LFIPAIAIITVFVMTDLSNSFNTIVRLRAGDAASLIQFHDPLVISLVYVAAFTFPYVVHKIWEFVKKKRHAQGHVPMPLVQP